MACPIYRELGGCRPDVDVITANPKTAGVARWNFFALWGARMDKGEAAALDYVTQGASLTSPPGKGLCKPLAIIDTRTQGRVLYACWCLAVMHLAVWMLRNPE